MKTHLRKRAIPVATISKADDRRAEQARMVAESRHQSVLNHAIPLCSFGPPSLSRPESGLDAATYFRLKAARGERGAFDSLWRLATQRREAA